MKNFRVLAVCAATVAAATLGACAPVPAEGGTTTTTPGSTTTTSPSTSTTNTTTTTSPNAAPTASFTVDRTTGPANLVVAFDASSSSDADGTVVSYAWDFGDATSGTGQRASHTFTAAGTYTARLTVTDDRGATATTTRSILATAPVATQADGGSTHACALMSDTTVRCWGSGNAGQLGDGTTYNHFSATPVKNGAGTADLRGVKRVAVGGPTTCALMLDGTAQCWGSNGFGQLGTGTKADSSLPTPVVGVGGAGTLSGITSIDLGRFYTCALLSDGSAACWGSNTYGQLGDGTKVDRTTPVPVRNSTATGPLTGITQFDAGFFHACARLSSGQARCWGANGSSQLGDGGYSNASLPVPVGGASSPLTGVVRIEPGREYTCALMADGGVQCWGSNAYGQLGDGTQNLSNGPRPVLGVGGTGTLTGVAEIENGYYHTCARLTSGGVVCWGYNSSGRLGNGSTSTGMSSRTSPGAVLDAAGTGALSGVTALASGDDFTCATLDVGKVDCWGANTFGQLGDGTTTLKGLPTEVVGTP